MLEEAIEGSSSQKSRQTQPAPDGTIAEDANTEL